MALSTYSSRQIMKSLPKEALLLFEIDNMTDVRPTSSIVNGPEDIKVGNNVTVVYDRKQLKAKIIELSGINIFLL